MTVRLPRLPAPGQTVLGSAFATTPGGKGANQAVAARRAGGEVVFVTAVGDDDLGRKALDLYRAEGIDVEPCPDLRRGVASGVALIFVGDDGENMIGVASGANHRLSPEDIDRLPDSLFRAGDVLLAGLEIPWRRRRAPSSAASRAGMQVILNPAPVPSIAGGRSRRACSRSSTSSRQTASRHWRWRAWTRTRPSEPDWNDCAQIGCLQPGRGRW